MKILNFVQDKLIFLTLGVIVLGLLNVKFFGGYDFTSLICLLAALVMIYPSLVPLSFDKFIEVKKHYKIVLISIILNFVIAPAIAYLVGVIILPGDLALRLGLIVLSLLPGGGMVTTWALKSKADMATTIGIILINLLLAIIIVPFGVSWFMGHMNLQKKSIENQLGQEMPLVPYADKFNNDSLSLDNKKNNGESCVVEKISQGKSGCKLGGEGITPLKIALPIIFIILFPLFLAFITQKIILEQRGEKYFQKVKKKFGAFSNLGLLIVLFVLMSLKNTALVFEQFDVVLRVFIGLLLFYGLTFALVYFLYKKFYYNQQGRALLWGSYLRYITLALGLAISLVYQNQNLSPIIIVIVLSYFIQIPSSFLIVKLLRGNE